MMVLVPDGANAVFLALASLLGPHGEVHNAVLDHDQLGEGLAILHYAVVWEV